MRFVEVVVVAVVVEVVGWRCRGVGGGLGLRWVVGIASK